MRYTIVIVIISFIFIGCSKDKFSSVPTLTYLSVNNNVFVYGDEIEFKLSFTDSEGDLSDSIYVEQVPGSHCANASVEGTMHALPIFPLSKNSKGEIIIKKGYRVNPSKGFNYNVNEPQCNINDTCYFRFVLKDKAQHKSDTVTSEKIVLIK
jgi:hypothetical protein